MIKFKKIKKNDMVKIIAGKDVGKSGKVLRVDRAKGTVLVEGLNLVKKTIRKSNKNQVGGIKTIEAGIDISNAQVICPKCKKSVRVGILVKENGDKVRICKKCSAEIVY
ncbi:MAG TPA: 50S ribosomal protein L24 [Spirochaetota bacterium]|mgnify:CR=1 FL=1|jgi:large subunit ribosomal protein L24|nr:MAG: 50S ribosomal protein L24 [Spirochaetes bacterium ADurb.Bin133]HNZ26549.1 50S ribosomal protein L24 [Spirochaetota bacterium]HOF02192.1 50S ribosomal protein L24 [Spirochaetota bacterium]HOS33797.1 50S ribosomal protein L24 [Spirochaetota bacterium]HOS55057.1 50S ribosomal protein L24 [Spirochaetota bacterium]